MLKKNVFYQTAFLSLGLLVICFISYGITLGKVGFFLDDWYIIWTYRTFGAAKFVEFFEGDRPLFSYVYRVFVSIFKDSVLAWQLLAIVTKWLSAVALWILLKMLMPHRKWLTYAVAALFLVYPGFKFHYFSVMKSQGYALFAIYILSHIFMVLAVRNPKKRTLFIAAATISQIIGIAPQEYYYGFELVRPVVLFLSLPEDQKEIKPRLLQSFRFWIPYLMVLVGFTFFRVSQSNLYSYQIGFLDQFKINPTQSILTFLSNMGKGVYESVANVWIALVKDLVEAEDHLNQLIRFGLIVLGGLVSLFFLSKVEHDEQDPIPWKQTAILIGLAIYVVLATMIPFLLGGFTIGLEWHNNRFLSPVSLGVSLLIVAFIELTIKKKQVKLLLLALIMGLSMEASYVNGLAFINAWNQQTDFFTQLTWRAPQIEPGTVLITPDVPFGQYFSGPSLTAPLNMIYAPELAENPIPYQIMLAGTPQMDDMPELIPDQEIDRTSRVFNFIGNTSNMIAIYQPQQGCLQVLSSETDPQSFQSNRYAEMWKELIALSNVKLIDTKAQSAMLPEEFFAKNSTDTWCYYYQRAALAEQEKSWELVVEEYNSAENAGFTAISTREWLPLIRASIILGEKDTALEVSSRILLEDDFARRGLCSAWETYYRPGSTLEQERLDSLLEQWHCEE